MKIRFQLLILSLFILLQCLSAKPDPYIRIQETPEGEIKLQVALRKLKHAENEKASVIWLSGVAHIGAESYYKELQKHLDAQELVLFEGVGFFRDKESRKKGERGAGSFRPEMVDHSIQGDLAKALGLVFQLSIIDYERPNFLNSDLSANEFMAYFEKGSENSILSGDAKEDKEVTRFMAIMAGSSTATKILQFVLKIFGRSPRFQGMARLVLIETLGTVGNDFSDIKGMPEQMKKLMHTLIQERNKVVLKDLRKTLRPEKAPESISIFYGAAHMPHMESRICKSLGYEPAGDTWLTCFSVIPSEQGLRKSDIALVRRMVAMQIKKYQDKK